MPVLRLFAAAREAAGTASVEVTGVTVDEVLAAARARFGPELGAVIDASKVWRNGEPASGSDPVGPGDEVAVLPPVSGGSGPDRPRDERSRRTTFTPAEPPPPAQPAAPRRSPSAEAARVRRVESEDRAADRAAGRRPAPTEPDRPIRPTPRRSSPASGRSDGRSRTPDGSSARRSSAAGDWADRPGADGGRDRTADGTTARRGSAAGGRTDRSGADGGRGAVRPDGSAPGGGRGRTADGSTRRGSAAGGRADRSGSDAGRAGRPAAGRGDLRPDGARRGSAAGNLPDGSAPGGVRGRTADGSSARQGSAAGGRADRSGVDGGRAGRSGGNRPEGSGPGGSTSRRGSAAGGRPDPSAPGRGNRVDPSAPGGSAGAIRRRPAGDPAAGPGPDLAKRRVVAPTPPPLEPGVLTRTSAPTGKPLAPVEGEEGTSRATRLTRMRSVGVPVTGSITVRGKERKVSGVRERRTTLGRRYAVVYDTDGPKVTLGVLWFVAIMGGVALGWWVLTFLFAIAAGWAAMEAADRWRERGVAADPWVAALGAGAVAAAGAAGAGFVGIAILVVVLAAITRMALSSMGRDHVLSAAGNTVGCAIPFGLASASVVLANDLEIGAVVALLLFASAYDAGDHLIGSGSSNSVEGPLTGIVTIGVVAMAIAVLGVPPFEGIPTYTFAVFAAVLCPLGQMAASAILPANDAYGPSVRRLDSLLLLAPIWVWSVGIFMANR